MMLGALCKALSGDNLIRDVGLLQGARLHSTFGGLYVVPLTVRWDVGARTFDGPLGRLCREPGRHAMNVAA